MPVAIELKYYNSFWIKKIASLANNPNKPVFNDPEFPENIPVAYTDKDGEVQTITPNIETDWIIEEARIRGGYNNTSVDFGVKAYSVEDEPRQSNKVSGLIYSGIFNSRTGFNATNQFSVGEDITRTIDPSNGSIQRLYAEDTNLIIFQESKVSKSLIDKDAVYSAEGNASLTTRNLVIGQNVAFAGEYGISTDPESFAVNGYRKYFTDKRENVVCRLSMDGITIISNNGMTDFFRDKLATSEKIRGGWDAHNKQYVLSIEGGSDKEGAESYITTAFDETTKGWVSLFDYKPNNIVSLNNNFYTSHQGKLYKHYELQPSSTNRGNFYGVNYDSEVTILFNAQPSIIKNFQTINYEGDSGWQVKSLITNEDQALEIKPNTLSSSLAELQNNNLVNNFKKKEDKYFASITNASNSQFGEVIWGSSSSGVKGFYAETTMKINNKGAGKKELFAVSTGFVRSS
jgi:competence protein ComGC